MGGNLDEPFVRIRPSRGWVALNLRDLWAYRELLYFLTWRDIKVRYKQTMLGIVWALIQPLFTMLIFTLLFGKLAGMPSDGIPYPLFALAGLLPWTFFANAVNASGNSLIAESRLITKVYFPRMLIPAAAVSGGLVDFAIAFGVLLGLMLYPGFGAGLTASMLGLPLLVLLMTLLAFGVGLWMAALNVMFRDVRYALPFLMQLWMFVSPIIYPASLVPEKWRWLLALNPMTGIIEGFRSALFGAALDAPALSLSVASTVVILIGSAYTFRRLEKSFADIV